MKQLNHKYNDIISLRWSHSYRSISRDRIITGLETMLSNLRIKDAHLAPKIEEDLETVRSGRPFKMWVDHRIPGEPQEYEANYAIFEFKQNQHEARPAVRYQYD